MSRQLAATIMMLTFALVVGCTPKAYRTGTVAVEKFSVDNVKVSDPISIRKDVLESIRDSFHKELLHEIQDDSKLKIATGCDVADYLLTGRFAYVDASNYSVGYMGFASHKNKFKIEIDGEFRDCKTNAVIEDFSEDKERGGMDDLLESLADEVVDEIKKVEIKPQGI